MYMRMGCSELKYEGLRAATSIANDMNLPQLESQGLIDATVTKQSMIFKGYP